jgi:3-oxoacyl-[acyl-carrier protein] reductase
MNKTVLITGAARGIGKAAALAFSEIKDTEKYNIIINYNSNDKAANDLALQLKNKGNDVLAVKADVSDYKSVDRMFCEIENKFGGADILVNNAGISSQRLFTDITEEEWDRMFAVNVKGVFNCSKRVLHYMINNKQGKIINVSSIWGITGASCEVHYSASKAAVIGMTKALAKELGPSNIQVNCVAPGVIYTDMTSGLDEETINALKEQTPSGTIGSPSDIANAILFLASNKSDFITGQVISPNGGFLI